MAGISDLFPETYQAADQNNLSRLMGDTYKGWRPSANVSADRTMDTPSANMARMSMYDVAQSGLAQNAAAAMAPASSRWWDEEIDKDSPSAVPHPGTDALLQHLRNTEPYNFYAGDFTGSQGYAGGRPAIALQSAPAPTQQLGGVYSPETNPADNALAQSVGQSLVGQSAMPWADALRRR
jgi:hypothetical protein